MTSRPQGCCSWLNPHSGTLLDHWRSQAGPRRPRLVRSEWLVQQDTVGQAAGSPLVRRGARYIDYLNILILFSGEFRDLPAIELPAQIDVGYQSANLPWLSSSKETASSPFDAMTDSNPPSVRASSTTALDQLIVFDDQNYWQVLHESPLCSAQLRTESQPPNPFRPDARLLQDRSHEPPGVSCHGEFGCPRLTHE
jgi:hypothetical protein